MATPSDFTFPKGKIEQSYFPGEVLADLLQAWIDEAEAKVSALDPEVHAAAINNWVYYRGFDTIANRLAMEPDQAEADGTSRQISTGRVSFFRSQAQGHLDGYQSLVQSASTITSRPTSRSVSTRAVF